MTFFVLNIPELSFYIYVIKERYIGLECNVMTTLNMIVMNITVNYGQSLTVVLCNINLAEY